MTGTIKKESSEFMFNNLVSAIKILAGRAYRDKEPFVYNDGAQVVACLVMSETITFMYYGK